MKENNELTFAKCLSKYPVRMLSWPDNIYNTAEFAICEHECINLCKLNNNKDCKKYCNDIKQYIALQYKILKNIQNTT